MRKDQPMLLWTILSADWFLLLIFYVQGFFSTSDTAPVIRWSDSLLLIFFPPLFGLSAVWLDRILQNIYPKKLYAYLLWLIMLVPVGVLAYIASNQGIPSVCGYGVIDHLPDSAIGTNRFNAPPTGLFERFLVIPPAYLAILMIEQIMLLVLGGPIAFILGTHQERV